MQAMTTEVLDEIEKKHPEGLSSQQILSLLEASGVRFSEATLRKYVQLGLLPHSVRVGRKGKNKGSEGLYPTSVLRRIAEIKRLLGENFTIDEIRQDYFLLRGEIEALEQKLGQVFDGVEAALTTRSTDTATEHVRRELRDVRATAGELITKLRGLETRLSLRAQMARAAL